MTHWQTLRLDRPEAGIARLTLHRPERRNAINRAMTDELNTCLAGLALELGLRVLLLTGAGDCFSAGGDLKERLACGTEASRGQRHELLAALDRLDCFPCPVIAVIPGPALAGGLELALACDIRIAALDAVLGLPEVRTSGGFPGASGPVRLARELGRGLASLLVYAGCQISASDALAMGLVERAVPREHLDSEALSLARQIAEGSPSGIRAAKQLIRAAGDLDFDSAMVLSAQLREPLDDGPDCHEAVRAWCERRAPRFAEAS